MAQLKGAGPAAAAKHGSRQSPDMQRLLTMLEARKLTPAIVFSFARKECEFSAMHAKKLSPLSAEDQQTVQALARGHSDG